MSIIRILLGKYREYLAERNDPAGDEPLFLSQKGGAISSYAVWYTVKKYAALAEVEGVSPHTFCALLRWIWSPPRPSSATAG